MTDSTGSPWLDGEPPDRAPVTTPPPVRLDRLTAALGNAALPGLGHAIARRWLTAAAALAGAALWLGLALETGQLRYEVLLVLWWVLGIAHGALLRGVPARRPGQTARHVTAGVMALAVLLGAGFLRHQAATVAENVESARGKGDCAGVRSAQGRLWIGTWAANAPLAAEGERTVAACARLDEARELLARGLKGDKEALAAGFAVLDAARPGDAALARSALDGFLRRIRAQEACNAAVVTSWLRDHRKNTVLRGRAADAAERQAPTALSGCGDARMALGQWPRARDNFRQLLADYPDNALADHARSESTRATHELELMTVQDRLNYSRYCENPAGYGAAPPYGKGENRAVFTAGDDADYISDLPDSWRTEDPRKATMIVCTGPPSHGDVVETCRYTTEMNPYGPAFNVHWTKVKLRVKVYELRTGKLVADRSVQISGSSCPDRHRTYQLVAEGMSEYVTPSKADVRRAFASPLKR
ncbi:hypothetical protein ACFY7Z_01155 [Streptomyces sp. NPDC012623]|uniref:hypothetical protein n=1 Tax=unclassified Streptomyces TaxID=2593676 RepID=UPI0036B180C5